MKKLALVLFASAVAMVSQAQTVREALANPASAVKIVLSGQPDEARLLTRNGAKFTSLQTVEITGINDSVQSEQAIIAVAACPSVYRLILSNSNLPYISGGIRMLTEVMEVKISSCDRLRADQAFTVLSEMPGLLRLEYETPRMSAMPRSFARLRRLDEIFIVNKDIALADGYSRNTRTPDQLYSEKRSDLGFGEDMMILRYGCYDAGFAQSHLFVMRDILQGTAGITGEMPLAHPAKAFVRNHPLVHAPIAGMEVAKNIYTTIAENGGLLEYPSGTRIMIPANAFVDAKGNPLKGEVTIDYREFRDPVDVIVSGIPMKYDSAGAVGDFKSAGMFEINASVNGEEVFLAPGKTVNLDFAVTDTADTYNFYELDEKDGWVYRGRPGAELNQQQDQQQESGIVSPVKMTEAVAYYQRLLLPKRMGKADDTTGFDERYLDTNYCYLDKKGANFYRSNGRVRNPKTASKIYLRKTLTKKDHVLFQIDRSYTGIYARENHQEIYSVRGVYWRLEGKYKSRDFNKAYGKRKAINDFRIEYDGGTDFVIELKDARGWQRLSVTPVHLNGQGKEIPFTAREAYRLNRQYSRALSAQRRQTDRKAKREKRHIMQMRKHLVPDTLQSWKTTRYMMNPDEKKMSFADWKAYVSESFAREMAALNSQKADVNNLTRSLSIDGFGIFNCDQIQRIPDPIQVFAVIEDESGNHSKPEMVYVVDKGLRSVFCYSKGFNLNGTGNMEIAYGAKSDNFFVAVENGEMYVGGNEAFTAHPHSGHKQVFQVKKISGTVSLGELRTMIYPAE